MNLKKFGPFTVYWKEADILGPAKLSFNASSFFVDGMQPDFYPSLSQIDNDWVSAWEFFDDKTRELAGKHVYEEELGWNLSSNKVE